MCQIKHCSVHIGDKEKHQRRLNRISSTVEYKLCRHRHFAISRVSDEPDVFCFNHMNHLSLHFPSQRKCGSPTTTFSFFFFLRIVCLASDFLEVSNNKSLFFPSFSSLYINVEYAQVSRLGHVLESADIPSAVESLHVGGNTAS